jgi:hypothetical protein
MKEGAMPHEKINYPKPTPIAAKPLDSNGVPVPLISPRVRRDQLVVGWNELGWVQISMYPEGWSSTGDAEIIDLSSQEIDLLIKTLRRAQRQAYASGHRHSGFEDTPLAETRPLFTETE